jgi:hypothetical protein
MKRRSKAGGGAPNARGRKTATLKRRKVSNDAVRRSSSAAAAEGQVARLRRELNDARDQQTATGGVLKVISHSRLRSAGRARYTCQNLRSGWRPFRLGCENTKPPPVGDSDNRLPGCMRELIAPSNTRA